MRLVIALVVAAAVMSGCGTVARSSGAMQVGPDTYKLTARAPMGVMIDSQKMAFTEANAHCASMAKQLMTTATSASSARGTYEVTYRCLNAGDPDLARPNLIRTPDVLIESR